MEGKSAVPMEIIFMDNGGNIFVSDEFIEQMNSGIHIPEYVHVNLSII